MTQLNLFKRGTREYGSTSLKKEENTFFVFAHGNKNVVYDDREGNRKPLNHIALSKMIKSNSQWKSGMIIKLGSCNTGDGTNSIAQKLANIMGETVIAPNWYYWPTHGNPNAQVGWLLAAFPPGRWVTFNPYNKR